MITGAGRGIGKRLAIGFAKAGFRVGLLGRSARELDVTRMEIEQAGGLARSYEADVRDTERVAAAIDKLEFHHGEIAVLIANAGVQGPIGPFAAIDPARWKDVVDINLMGTMSCFRAVLPRMIARRRGKLLAIAGGGAFNRAPEFRLLRGFEGSRRPLLRMRGRRGARAQCPGELYGPRRSLHQHDG